jgi:hypothetical protein
MSHLLPVQQPVALGSAAISRQCVRVPGWWRLALDEAPLAVMGLRRQQVSGSDNTDRHQQFFNSRCDFKVSFEPAQNVAQE